MQVSVGLRSLTSFVGACLGSYHQRYEVQPLVAPPSSQVLEFQEQYKKVGKKNWKLKKPLPQYSQEGASLGFWGLGFSVRFTGLLGVLGVWIGAFVEFFVKLGESMLATSTVSKHFNPGP